MLGLGEVVLVEGMVALEVMVMRVAKVAVTVGRRTRDLVLVVMLRSSQVSRFWPVALPLPILPRPPIPRFFSL